MSTGSRKNTHKENLRTLILETSINIISKTGYENLKMRLLADSIDYSPRTIYLYFKNKEDLLNAVIEKVFSDTLTQMSSSEYSEMPPEEIIRTMISRHIRNGLQQPALYRSVINGINREGHESGPSESILSERINRMFTNCLTIEKRENSVQISEILLASLRSTTLLLINKHANKEKRHIEKIIIIYSDIILRGIL
jgi:AcrR family transcriptional regulator